MKLNPDLSRPKAISLVHAARCLAAPLFILLAPSHSSAATVRIWTGASTTSGDWTSAANWSSGAPVASPGRLTAQGNADLANSDLRVEINGTVPASQYDEHRVTGNDVVLRRVEIPGSNITGIAATANEKMQITGQGVPFATYILEAAPHLNTPHFLDSHRHQLSQLIGHLRVHRRVHRRKHGALSRPLLPGAKSVVEFCE